MKYSAGDSFIDFKGYKLIDHNTDVEHSYYTEGIMMSDFIDFIDDLSNEKKFDSDNAKYKIVYELEVNVHEGYESILPYHDSKLTTNFKGLDKLKEYYNQFSSFFDVPIKKAQVVYVKKVDLSVVEIYYVISKK